MTFLLLQIFMVITVLSQTHSSGVDSWAIVKGDQDVISQCNITCIYVSWAFDANCKKRNLEAVPQECWQAKMLDLRDNKIVRVVANVFESFRNLLFVDLEDNGITALDTNAFVGNDGVRQIYLQSNHLESIRRGTFTGVPNLLRLYLNSNRISTIEVGAFSGLFKLEIIFLSKNELDDIPIGLLKGLERLKYFYMTHNRLTSLRNNTFKELLNLRNLNFIKNNIQTIEANAFKGLMSLRVLQLAYNDISVIGFRAFAPLHQLIQLNLYSNKIETISNFTINIRNIEELLLGDNPLKCNCQLEVLQLWYQKHEITDSKANATCNGPDNVKGMPVANMDIMVCPTPTDPPKYINEESVPLRAHVGENPREVEQKGNSDQQCQNSTVQSSTIAVIVITCIVLFAVCLVGLICFMYNVYIRELLNHKLYYKPTSKMGSDYSDTSKQKTGTDQNSTVNPIKT